VQCDGATHQLRKPLADAESQTSAAEFARGGHILLCKRIKNSFLMFRRNPDATVFNGNFQRQSIIGGNVTNQIDRAGLGKFNALLSRLFRICCIRTGSP
jgi:hypothetical protein